MRLTLALCLALAPALALAQPPAPPPRPDPPPLPSNGVYSLPISEGVRGEQALRAYGVSFYFASETTPLGREVEVIRSGRMGSARPFLNVAPCAAAFQAALEELARQAKTAGADMVTQVTSDPAQPWASTPWSYLCDKGGVELTGVAVARAE